jgi:hypothetical protein
MDVRIVKTERCEGGLPDSRRDFTALIDGVKVVGTARNFVRFQTNGNSYRQFGLSLHFHNPEVKKHPKYKEIRTRIIEQILEDNYDSYFAIGVNLRYQET